MRNRRSVDVTLVTQRATVLARIGIAGQRALIPIGPDCLAAPDREPDSTTHCNAQAAMAASMACRPVEAR